MAAPKKRKNEDFEFQMEFYEGILKENPNYVDALIALGEIYTKKGLYDKGLKIDKRLARLRPNNPIIHYNLACSLSLMGDLTQSLRAIKRAVELGYSDFVFLNNDPDLSNLRQDEKFNEFISKMRKSSLDNQNAAKTTK